MFKLITGAVLLSAVAISPALAATLDGDSVTVSYVLNGKLTTFGTFTVPDVTINVSRDPNGLGTISGNTASYTFGRFVDFDALGLSSVMLTDNNPTKTITGVNVSTVLVSGLTDSDLSVASAGNAFTINLTGVTAQAAGSAIFSIAVASAAPSTVPLPASAPLFGAALLALSAVGFGAKRRRALNTAA